MTDHLDARLATIEALLDDMAGLLVRGDAPALETAALSLRQSMAELASTTGREPAATFHEPAVRDRMQRVSHALTRQRDNIARRSVIAERGLAAVLPQNDATYTTPGRASLFRGSAARLYKSPSV